MSTWFRNRASSPTGYIVAFVLLFNSFSWFLIGQIIVDKMALAFAGSSIVTLSLELAYPVSIAVSSLVGAACFAKTRRGKFLSIWLFVGIIVSLLPGFSTGFPLFTSVSLIMLIGSSFGVGMPSCLSLFAQTVPIEKRGKVGGTVFLLTMLATPLIILALQTLDLTSSAIVFAAWRGWSLLILFFMPHVHSKSVDRLPTTYSSLIRDRPFVLYFVAWLMFCLVDGLESVVLARNVEEFHGVMILIEPAVAGFSALLGGMFSDWIGRKKVVIFGFISLGVAHAVLGIFSQVWFARVFFFVVNGVAIGLLWALFTIVLWGDMSRNGSEKHYALGETPLFLTEIVSLVFAPYVALIEETSAFSVAAFFLFVAVIPLLFAVETLPEKKIQQRQLRIYTEEALKLKQGVEQKQK